jgi:predicted phage tail protein
MLKKLILHGAIVEDLGQSQFEFEANSLSDCMEMLRTVYDRAKLISVFKKYNFEVFEDDKQLPLNSTDMENIKEDDLQLLTINSDAKEYHLVPHIIGAASSSTWQMVAGVVLIIIGVILNFTPAAGASPFFYKLGASLLISGVIGYLTQPKLKKTDDDEGYMFNSVTNSIQEGSVLPIVFGGPILVGSVQIQTELYSNTII